MKANYVKPSLKIKEIDTAESMLDGSKGNNLVRSGNDYNGSFNSQIEVDGVSALSKQGYFLGNQWDNE